MANLQDVSIGWKKEASYGTASTVDRWVEFVDETLDYARMIKQGQGLKVGLGGVARSARRVTPTSAGSGDVTVELFSKGLGTLFEAALGTGAVATVTTSVYQHLFTLGSATVPMTIQKGLVKDGGTVTAYTFNGCVVSNLDINVPQGEIATAKVGWDMREVTTATAYATPSYSTGGGLFHWGQAAATIGGTVTAPTTNSLATGGTAVTNIRDFSLSLNNNIAADNYRMGGGGKKSQPTPGIRAITGSITADYTDDVLPAAYLADTELALTLTLTSTTDLITGSSYSTFQVVLPAVKLDSQVPRVNGGNLISTTYNFTALDNGTATQPIWLVMRTADAAL